MLVPEKGCSALLCGPVIDVSLVALLGWKEADHVIIERMFYFCIKVSQLRLLQIKCFTIMTYCCSWANLLTPQAHVTLAQCGATVGACTCMRRTRCVWGGTWYWSPIYLLSWTAEITNFASLKFGEVWWNCARGWSDEFVKYVVI